MNLRHGTTETMAGSDVMMNGDGWFQFVTLAMTITEIKVLACRRLARLPYSNGYRTEPQGANPMTATPIPVLGWVCSRCGAIYREYQAPSIVGDTLRVDQPCRRCADDDTQWEPAEEEE